MTSTRFFHRKRECDEQQTQKFLYTFCTKTLPLVLLTTSTTF
jgi:hypothetical protein